LQPPSRRSGRPSRSSNVPPTATSTGRPPIDRALEHLGTMPVANAALDGGHPCHRSSHEASCFLGAYRGEGPQGWEASLADLLFSRVADMQRILSHCGAHPKTPRLR
jgi:hypothetical protein